MRSSVLSDSLRFVMVCPPWTLVGLRRRAWSRESLLALIGLIVLGLWASWWSGSYEKNRLRSSPAMWFERHTFVGLDFLHNYHAARHWMAGGDPYTERFGDPLDRKLCYPPIVLTLFSWCALVGPRTAVGIWMVTLSLIATGATFAAWRARFAMGLTPISLPMALAGILISTPMCYAMERGNYDLLVLPCVLGAAWALQERSLKREGFAGVCLGLAVCLKIYPALLIAGLIPLRRFRAAVFAGVAVLGFGGFQADRLPAAVTNLKEMAHLNKPERATFIAHTSHSLGGNWRMAWDGTKLAVLKDVPANVATAAILGPALMWVAVCVYRCGDPRSILLPLLLWTTAVATFVPTVANDYSLLFLPLAALAVWDRRDPPLVHLAIGMMVFWAEPIRFTIGAEVLLLLKVVTVYGTAAALTARIRECAPVLAPSSNDLQGVRTCDPTR